MLMILLPVAAQDATIKYGYIPLLVIPAINLSAPVVSAPLSRELGTWDVSHINMEVAHLEHTPYFGSPGNTVIAGHLDKYGNPSIFFNLSSVRVGNQIEIWDGTSILIYTVTRQSIVSRNDLSILQNTSAETITLFTCYGTLDAASERYSLRYVVVAERTS